MRTKFENRYACLAVSMIVCWLFVKRECRVKFALWGRGEVD